MKRSYLILGLSLIFCLAFLFIFRNSLFEKGNPSLEDSSNPLRAENLEVDEQNLSRLSATLKTVHGDVVIKFYPKVAPNTVTRIIKLIDEGFYDGIVFHRVIPNYIVQAGDPTGAGTGGTGVKLKAEFNSMPHVQGTVAMARTQVIDSADSQFYIALTRLEHLDQKYTVFGQVVAGMEVLPLITQGDKIITFTLKK